MVDGFWAPLHFKQGAGLIRSFTGVYCANTPIYSVAGHCFSGSVAESSTISETRSDIQSERIEVMNLRPWLCVASLLTTLLSQPGASKAQIQIHLPQVKIDPAENLRNLKKTAENASNTAKKAADDTGAAVKKGADDVAKTASKAADDAAKTARKAADDTATVASKAAKDVDEA